MQPIENKRLSYMARDMLKGTRRRDSRASFNHEHKESLMKHISRSIRPHLLAALAAVFGVVGTATAAGPVGISVQTRAGGQAAPVSAQAGGQADAHMHPSAAAHGNAQWQSGAARGAARAEQVRSESADLEAELTGAASVSGGRPAR